MDARIKCVVDKAIAETGYLEKQSDRDLYSKKANAGDRNYTKYGKEMYAIYPSVMDYPAYWCDCYVDWLFKECFGIENARKMLCGNFDDYTVNSANMYKQKGRWFSKPQIGDQIFFHNNKRINHTGLVINVSGTKVYTSEGNTSDGSEIVRNGGGVFVKCYDINNPRIAGYGRPIWDVVNESNYIKTIKAEPTYPKLGWFKTSDNRWQYAIDNFNVAKACWKLIENRWYVFDNSGNMIVGWFKSNNDWYYLNDADGTMVANQWFNVDGKWYYFEPDGKMLFNGYIYDSANDEYLYVDEYGVYGEILNTKYKPSGYRIVNI